MTAVPQGRAQFDEGGGEGWVDRYRPTNLEDMALAPADRQLIEMYVESRRLQSLILHGPSGTGKTTLAKIVVRHLIPAGNVMEVNASARTGIDEVRERIIPYLRAYHLTGLVNGERSRAGAVLLSEADGLSADAQAALKDPMEAYASENMIIFTTNALDDLDDAIRSRCRVIEMGPPPVAERARVLARILGAEGHVVEAAHVLQFADRYPDMREMVRAAEDSFGVHGSLVTEPLAGEPEFWPQPVDGPLLLSGLAEAFSRYLSLPPEAPTALALWVLFAHAHEAFGYSPILAAISAIKRSGKTRLFEVLYQLVPNPVFTSNITPASIYRMGGETDPHASDRTGRTRPSFTLLADEGDTWLKLRRELQGILNSGHTRRAAFVIRVSNEQATAYSTWFPKALALIDTGMNSLPPTVQDRSILIPMQRRRSDEVVTPLRSDRNAEDLAALKSKCARWVRDYFAALREATVEMPERIGDRTADNWRPLLTVGAVAGGEWRERAARACLVLTCNDEETEEIKLLLLRDIRDAFAEYGNDRVPTSILLEILGALVERQWRRMLSAFKLSQLLRPFGIYPRPLWGAVDGGEKKTLRGYFLSDFTEAFARYL
jgi:hypothetical protein